MDFDEMFMMNQDFEDSYMEPVVRMIVYEITDEFMCLF